MSGLVEGIARILDPEAWADDHPFNLQDRAAAMSTARSVVEALPKLLAMAEIGSLAGSEQQ